jgi:hypothetical protein
MLKLKDPSILNHKNECLQLIHLYNTLSDYPYSLSQKIYILYRNKSQLLDNCAEELDWKKFEDESAEDYTLYLKFIELIINIWSKITRISVYSTPKIATIIEEYTSESFKYVSFNKMNYEGHPHLCF